MQPKRTYTSLPVGELFSAHIFGGATPISLKSSFTTKPKRVPATREDKVTFISLTENVTPVLAVLPFLNSTAFAETMDNYRLYIAHYNKMVREANTLIAKENALIELSKLTEVQKAFSAIFYKRNSHLKAKEFNQLADKFNQERGLTIQKKKFRTVKYASEIVFQQMLHLYCGDLAKFGTEYEKLGVNELSPVRQMDVNAQRIYNLKRNGVSSIDVCKATIRNHRAILEEAGVLVDYLYKGHKTGVKQHINSQILVVFDAKNQNLTVPDIQRFTDTRCKDFKDNNEVTRTIITVNKTENRKSDFPDLGTASPDLSFVFYKNLPTQEEKSKLGGREKTVKISETIYAKLLQITLADTNFATRLANGEYFNHKRIDKVHLYKEATYGTLIREEFLQVIKHEFFKNLSKIYRQSTPYAGSYQKAMNEFEDRFYVNNGNGKFLVRKEVMVDMLQKYLWMVNKANNWFLKTGIRPLNPHDYLDKTRSHKKEIGFYYLQKSYAKHLKELENKPLQAKKAAKNAELRKKVIDYSTKFNQKINAFKANRITVDELIEYVDKNLPPIFMQNLSDMLIKEMSYSQSKYDC
jgi:hypothetical protein